MGDFQKQHERNKKETRAMMDGTFEDYEKMSRAALMTKK